MKTETPHDALDALHRPPEPPFAAATPFVRSPAAMLAAAAGVVGFALLTAAAAQMRFPIPGSPVPATLQTVVVVLAGVTLGSRLGALSMLFYLLLGTAGYQVFAGGPWGQAPLLGATGGYLIGFVLAQPLAGILANPQARGAARWIGIASATLASNAVIFAAGVLWLAGWLGVDLATALDKGFWPFAGWSLAKMLLTAAAAGPLLGVRAAWTARRG